MNASPVTATGIAAGACAQPAALCDPKRACAASASTAGECDGTVALGCAGSGSRATRVAASAATFSFRVAGLAELRAAHDRVAAEGVADLVAVTHGNAWSIYFLDPDGNRLEIFADTPWYVRQPLREPIDFALADDEILRRTEALCRALPDFKPVATWQAEMAGRMRAAAEA